MKLLSAEVVPLPKLERKPPTPLPCRSATGVPSWHMATVQVAYSPRPAARQILRIRFRHRSEEGNGCIPRRCTSLFAQFASAPLL